VQKPPRQSIIEERTGVVLPENNHHCRQRGDCDERY
jgi:hypothetical protein